MNLFNFFKRGGSSAPVARDRLQILLAYERKGEGPSELLFTLREEILAVVGRHVEINPDRVTVQMDRGDKVSILEVEIEVQIPSGHSQRRQEKAGGIAPGVVIAPAALLLPHA
jgi:cell division topological specificity factor MinE